MNMKQLLRYLPAVVLGLGIVLWFFGEETRARSLEHITRPGA